MRRDQFTQILKFIRWDDNKIDKFDKAYKLRPFMNKLKKNFMKNFVPVQKIDFNESMIKYFVKHGYKQFIRGKPIRFGFIMEGHTYVSAIDKDHGIVFITFFFFQVPSRVSLTLAITSASASRSCATWNSCSTERIPVHSVMFLSQDWCFRPILRFYSIFLFISIFLHLIVIISSLSDCALRRISSLVIC